MKGQDTTIPISQTHPSHGITSVKSLLTWLVADRDDGVHGHVDEPSVGVLLSWLINDDNNDDDHDDNDDGHGHGMAMMMYMVVASGGDDDNAAGDDDVA